MPFVVGFVATEVALGISAVTGAVVSVGAVETALTVAAVAGVSYVAYSQQQNALKRALTPLTPEGATPLAALNGDELKVNVKQAAPYQKLWYGRQRSGGPIVWYQKNGNKLVVQHLLSRRKLSRIRALYLNGNTLTFADAPFDSIIAPLAIEGQPDYPGNLRICFQAGQLAQPINPLLAANFPDLDADWRLPGTANVVAEYSNYDDSALRIALWGNVEIPDLQVDADGAPLYDPRRPLHRLPADPSDIYQWFAAQETWDYSDTAKLIQADFLWQADGLNAGPGGINWEKLKAEIARDEEACGTRNLDGAGKTVNEKRYVMGAIVSLDQRSADVFDGMLACSRSNFIQDNSGICWIGSDRPKPRVFTIRDDMIVGPVSFQAFKPRGQLANVTTAQFVAAGRSGENSDAPTLRRADLVAQDGGELALQTSLPYTNSPSTAQRIQKANLADARIERSWQGVIDLSGLGLRADDRVDFASDLFPQWNEAPFVADEGDLAIDVRGGNSGLALKLVGYDPAVADDWQPAVDDQLFEDASDLAPAA